MQTSNTLALMQSVATLALMLSLSFAYLINPLEDSIFFSVLNSFSKSLYDSNVINELNTSVIAGIIIGLFLGTTNILLSSSKKVYNYVANGREKEKQKTHLQLGCRYVSKMAAKRLQKAAWTVSRLWQQIDCKQEQMGYK